MEIKTEIDIKGLQRYIKKLGNRTPIYRKLAHIAIRGIKRRVREGQITPISKRARQEGGKTLLDTGRMLKSIRLSVVNTNGAIIVAGGAGVKYAAIHHYGGTVHNVVIPLFHIPKSKRATMSLRIQDAIKDVGTGPRGGRIREVQYPAALKGARVFWGTSKAGNRILFAKKGNKLIPLYVFKKSVKIPTRKWFVVDNRTRNEMKGELRNWLAR